MCNNLRKFRTAANLSVADLANMTGLTQSVIYGIEAAGKVSRNVHERTTWLLANALGCSVHQLFDPQEVVTKGRPPLACNQPSEAPPANCPNCFITLPNTGKCDDCDYDHKATTGQSLTLVGQG